MVIDERHVEQALQSEGGSMNRHCAKLFFLCLACLIFGAGLAVAVESAQQGELIVSVGVIEQADLNPAQRITGLEGKTVALLRNGKHCGDIALDRLAGPLAKKVPSLKVVNAAQAD